jgi:3-dehydroquinate synthase
MRTHFVKLTREEISYPIHCEAGLFSKLASLLPSELSGQKTLILTDENVEPLYANYVVDALDNLGSSCHLFSLKPGEGQKSLDSANAVYNLLISKNYDRGSYVIALGGGVVGDLAGFVAATFMRGIKLIQIPTTLLSQVDASVGGKTGINHELGKNLIGAFHHPVQVLIDPNCLGTLPGRELNSGLSEVIKTALIADAELFNLIEEKLDEILSGTLQSLNEIIPRCYEIKREIVSQDERESGIRANLNFGHTFGHALETATGYESFTHGEAVLWGMCVAIELSTWRDLLNNEVAARILSVLAKLPTPAVPEIGIRELEKLLLRDKKTRDGKINYIFLEEVGIPYSEHSIEVEEIIEAFQQVRGAVA